jgi:hypothetical protein
MNLSNLDDSTVFIAAGDLSLGRFKNIDPIDDLDTGPGELGPYPAEHFLFLPCDAIQVGVGEGRILGLHVPRRSSPVTVDLEGMGLSTLLRFHILFLSRVNL